MRRITSVVAVVASLLLISVITPTINYTAHSQEEQKSFYVGVTYCGSSVEEAKELIDEVKGYTNLFVLQSGPFMQDIAAMKEIGDYAVSSNLSYAVSSSMNNSVKGLSNRALSNWLIEAKERWGKQFIGIYYNDEPGGEMLDKSINFAQTPKDPDGLIFHFGGSTISKSSEGIHFNDGDNQIFYDYFF
ncbi:MAG: hypothetical protein LBC03_06445 [Nitrososphaerota archaeon]|jgi:hypothetical protein|nr:hypothetical protein [Nitrososphaerota archaeon]